MGLGKTNSDQEPPEFGAASDGDADRNMVLGKRFVFFFFFTVSFLTSILLLFTFNLISGSLLLHLILLLS